MALIIVEELQRIGLPKLLDYMDMTKEELAEFMVENDLLPLEVFCDFLAESTVICNYCGNDYGDKEDGGICYDCLKSIKSNRNWK